MPPRQIRDFVISWYSMGVVGIDFDIPVRPEVFNEKHEFDATRLARAFDVPVSTIARAIGKESDTVRKRTSSPALQDGLGHLAILYSDLLFVHGGDRDAALRWLNTPNRRLKERARPLTLLQTGKIDVLEALVEAVRRRQPV